ncbi:MAG: nucleotidyltransferase domain-containing protein [Promethearchaeota archaeon]|nr:MAG: nucleotidyltransferase domain-containing protein [Candidatus Lokiarchaeota archaeon]
MVQKQFLDQILKDFDLVIKEKDVLGILLYGSYINQQETDRSDIDICIVAPTEDPFELLSFTWRKINVNAKNYDVRVFKELPLYIKIQIIENGAVIYSKNIYDLYEYFYIYRKLWDDQKHRQVVSEEELSTY